MFRAPDTNFNAVIFQKADGPKRATVPGIATSELRPVRIVRVSLLKQVLSAVLCSRLSCGGEKTGHVLPRAPPTAYCQLRIAYCFRAACAAANRAIGTR